MYRIKIDRSRCIGCLTCVTACVVSHQTESGDASNRVTIDSETKPAPIFCRHCDRPECVYTCMTGAMKKNPACLLFANHIDSLAAAGAVLADVWVDGVSMPVVDSLGEEFLNYVKDGMTVTIREDGTVCVEG